jgi:hypothetical protein
MCPRAGVDLIFQIVVEVLIWIQFRRIWREIENLYGGLVLFEPCGYGFAVDTLRGREIVTFECHYEDGVSNVTISRPPMPHRMTLSSSSEGPCLIFVFIVRSYGFRKMLRGKALYYLQDQTSSDMSVAQDRFFARAGIIFLLFRVRKTPRPVKESSMGLVLRAGKKEEATELMGLDKSGIPVAAYLMGLSPRGLLRKELHEAILPTGRRIEGEESEKWPTGMK